MAATQVSQRIHQYEESSVAVPVSGNATLAEIDMHQAQADEVVTVLVVNDGSTAYDAFVVSAKVTKNAPYVIIANAASDFTSPSLPFRWTNGVDLTTLASSGVGIFTLECRGIEAVKIEASQNTTAGTTDVYYVFGR